MSEIYFSTEVRGSKKKSLKFKLIAASVIASIIIISTIFIYSALVLSSTKIYSGVFVNEVNLSNKTKDEARSMLSEFYRDKAEKLTVTFTCGQNDSFTVKGSDINLQYKVDRVVEQAYMFGRDGGPIENVLTVASGAVGSKNIDLTVLFDVKEISERIYKISDNYYKPLIQPHIVSKDSGMFLRNGSEGISADVSKAMSDFIRVVKSGKSGNVKLELITKKPDKIKIDDIYKKIYKKKKEVTFIKKNGVVTASDSNPGIDIDKKVLTEIVADIESSKIPVEKELPVEYDYPSWNTTSAMSFLYKDTLSSMTTTFNTDTVNNKNRAVNIKLSVKKIDGYTLMPGETFSFNKVVGERTPEIGYKMAKTYTSEGMVDGFGGGICQVSSTLFNAALKADLNITERHYHLYTVHYVPYGLDAAIAYGSKDLKFKNNTGWPLKIAAVVTKNNELKFTLTGTNTTKYKRVEYTTKVIKSYSPKTKYIPDSSLAPGKTKRKSWGSKGYDVNTYKRVYISGKLQSESKIYFSHYNSLPTEILRGPARPTAATSVQSTAKPN